MVTFRRSIQIDATPEQVWEVLGDLGSVRRWVPGVTSVSVDGPTRVCDFADGHRQHEQILDLDPGARSYRYAILDAPLPVSANTGTFAVEAADGGARVLWESSFEPLDPGAADQLATMWEPYLSMTLEQLRHVIEG